MKDIRKYKAKHQGRVLWEKTDECVLGISVGQPDHEGEKFVLTVEWAAKRFERIHVVVSDTLQRHNISEGATDSQSATDICRQAGDVWLSRNSDALASSTVPLTVSRWDSWLNDPRFPKSYDQIQFLYNSHADLREVIERDARKYLQRSKRYALPNLGVNRAIANCIALILEECAVFCLVWEDHPGVDIYPGTELGTIRYMKTHQGFDVPKTMLNRRFARILFRRKLGSDS